MNFFMEAILLFIFLGTLLGIILCIVFYTIMNGISPMPTSSKVKKQLFDILPKQLNGTIVDLGSGWGTLVFPLAQHYPKNNVIGYESSPIPFVYCKLAQKFSRIDNLRIEMVDFFSVDLRDAALIVCYLYPGAMERLKEKFEKELKPGTIVISHTFSIHGWEPETIVKVDDLYQTPIFVYKM